MDDGTAETLIQLYAVLAFIGAAVQLLLTILVVAMGEAILSFLPFPGVTRPMLLFIGIVFAAFAVLDGAVGYGLWTHKQWARAATLVACCLQALSFPVGTIIGGFGIYLFGFNEDIVKRFK